MFSDPLSVTYDGTAKSLQRTSAGPSRTIYRTGDGEFMATVMSSPARGNGFGTASIELVRTLPDATPANVFDDYRPISNGFSVGYRFDLSRAEASVDIPRLRTALLALVDSTFQGRLISGEK